ncbi:MAG: glycosyltransferase [Prevotellaceae bacterium]|jgi:glycosyltransferase involved in cell wall biosynthesis|nr:glycosyltransferase [Prevotellaceae bacterium]
MKIIFIGTAYPYRGGLAAYNERLAAEFIREGNDVEIYTFTLQYPKILFPGKTQFSDDPAPKDLVIMRKINSVNPLNWLKIGREIRRKTPDLVFVRYWLPFMAPCLGTIARQIRKNRKTRVVTLLDNIIPHEKHPGDNFLTRFFVRSVDGFVAMSKSVLNDLKLFDSQKPRKFCPHPLYDNFGQPVGKKIALHKLQLDENKKYILFFGIIRNYKGLDLLMRAFADKRLQTMNIKLIVAGEFYGNSDRYFALEKELNLQGKIFWHTYFIPDSKVKYYFCAADIVAQTYYTATQSGVSQIAYHFEKPMLVTKVGGLPEIVPDGKVGYVVDIQANDIANALVNFFEKNRENEFIENIKTEKKKYAWSQMTQAIISVRNEVQ